MPDLFRPGRAPDCNPLHLTGLLEAHEQGRNQFP